jgi:DNA-binding SARP family transcriptional activator
MDCGMQINAGLKLAEKGAPATAETRTAYSMGKSGNGDRTPIRVHTLGRFSVTVDGLPMYSNRKSQQRPLALLKALIARGGHDVSCNLLWECLWPDSDGDLGARNLTITLHRLRHLLRTNAAVLHHDGKLSLNEQLCWLDVWHFERTVSDGLHLMADQKAREARLRAALDLYTGHFLALEAEESWMIEPRIRWKTKFERVVTALSVYLESEGRYADAVDLCLQTLALDPLNELLYRRLMNCYLKRGEFASALGTYLRCREALTKGLSAPISSETERLHLEALRAADKGSAQAVSLAPDLMVRSQSIQKRSVV